MIAKGDVFGRNQPLILHLLDIPPMSGVLEGVVMELADCALPLLVQVIPTSDPNVAFKDVSAAFLVGAMPRKEGMERKDLLSANVKIFKVQGEALDKFAKKDVKVLVVGNPANTNAFICSHYAPTIPRENFTAMTRLDQNRAQANIAAKVGVPIENVKNVIIWGNHSATQFPDAKHATVKVGNVEKSVYDAIGDENYLKSDFVTTIQKRGAAVIAARKMSSAMSAAKAATDHMHDWYVCDSQPLFMRPLRTFKILIHKKKSICIFTGGTVLKKEDGYQWELFQMAATIYQRILSFHSQWLLKTRNGKWFRV